MCGRPGGFLGNILAEIAYSFAMPGYGYASRPQASIGFSFSWVVFCRYKFIPTNTLKSRCILPTLYQCTTGTAAFTNPYPGAGVMIGSNKPFKKNAHVLFAEDKELVSQIQAGKYSSVDIVEVVKVYNKFMSEK